MLQVQPAPTLRPADFLPLAGAVMTVVLGHFLTRWRSEEQAEVATRRRAEEREEERRVTELDRLTRELSSAQRERQFWRERAQSYRTEVYVLRALVGPRPNLPPQTPDHDYSEDP